MFQSSQIKRSSSQCAKQSRIVIEDKFILMSQLKKKSTFGIYEAVDKIAHKMVIVYIKPTSSDFTFSRKIKEQLRNKISPAVLFSGNHQILKKNYIIQVHQKYGPSLKSMFSYIKDPISESDFLLLLFQMLKLVQKYSSVGYVFRNLDLESIVLDTQPQKHELYLFNVFSLCKKNQNCPVLMTKFCSRGAHLGLKANIKDDLQSICYILLNIFTDGKFLKYVQPENYLQAKSNIDFTSFKRSPPLAFIQFYNYVINLNYSDQPNLFKWRVVLGKLIGRQAMSNPYQWMISKGNQSFNSSFNEMENNAFSQPAAELSSQLLQLDIPMETEQIEDEFGPQQSISLRHLRPQLNRK